MRLTAAVYEAAAMAIRALDRGSITQGTALDWVRVALGSAPPNHPFYDALEELADEANQVPPDAAPGAWQDLALRFAGVVNAARAGLGSAPRGTPEDQT